MNEHCQNVTEGKLAEIWSELLDVEVVGPNDRFVELGGNSLLATIFINRVEELLQVRLELPVVFGKTLQQLAELCAEPPGNDATGTGAAE